MPYEFYKVLHILGLFMAVGAIGAVALMFFTHRTTAFPYKKQIMAYHGIATVIVFISGFGLMARTGITGGSWPAWIYVKMIIWFLVLGAAPTLVMRVPRPQLWSWWLIPALLGIAICAAVMKTNLI